MKQLGLNLIRARDPRERTNRLNEPALALQMAEVELAKLNALRVAEYNELLTHRYRGPIVRIVISPAEVIAVYTQTITKEGNAR
jgi:hypothetical protein